MNNEAILKIIEKELNNEEQAAESSNSMASSYNSSTFFKILNEKIIKPTLDFKFYSASTASGPDNIDHTKTTTDESDKSPPPSHPELVVERKRIVKKNKSMPNMSPQGALGKRRENPNDSSDAYSIVSQEEIDKIK
jgi:hypothetical protein